MALKIEVVIDATTAAKQSLARCLASIESNSHRHLAIRMPSRHLADQALADPSVDVFILTAPTYVWTPDSLPQIESAFQLDPRLDLLYGTDEPAAQAPRWSIDELRTHDYLGGVIAISGRLARKLVGFHTECYPYHRWDLVLRAAELTEAVAQADSPLGHRVDGGARLSNPECVRRGRQVLGGHLRRCGLPALVETTAAPGQFQVLPVSTLTPTVSIIVPSPSRRHLTLPGQLRRLEATLSGIFESGYQDLQVLVVTDNSMPVAALERLRLHGGSQTQVLPLVREGAMKWRYIEAGASRVTGEVVFLIEDDVLPESDDWLHTMAALAHTPSTGVVVGSFDGHRSRYAAEQRQLVEPSPSTTPGCVAMRRDLFVRLSSFLDDETGRQLPALMARRGLDCLTANYASFRRSHDDRAPLHCTT